MLIDCSFFTSGARHIQNASLGAVPNENALEVNESIKGYITAFQEEFLNLMLGYVLGPVVNEYARKFPFKRKGERRPTSVGELDLDENVCCEEHPHWSPSMDILCNQLRESFADYVFFQILRYSNSQATATGLVRLKCANDYLPPINRQVLAWNTMVERNRRFHAWSRSRDCLFKIRISDNMLKRINIFNL